MNTIKQLVITLALLALLAATPLFAQEGPYVPCVGCEDRVHATYPETGLWYNPDQSGSGFNLDFQNGIMAGFYYGYDVSGDPEWYLVTNKLTRSEQPGVMWELEVQPERYTGGNCLGCEYKAPTDIELLPAIKIEFLQRAYAKVTLSDGTIQYMVPIIYGSLGKAFFPEHTPYMLPVLRPDPWGSLWTVIIRNSSEEEFAPWTWESNVQVISEGEIVTGGVDEGKLQYRIWDITNPPEVLVPFARIYCDIDEEAGEPGCVLRASGLNPGSPVEFRISIGNFSDSRFFGETENGDTIEGFRLQYD